MHLFKFITYWSLFFLAFISGGLYLKSVVHIDKTFAWIEKNVVVSILAFVGGIAIIWIVRKLFKAIVVLAGLGLIAYYGIEYAPKAYDVLAPYKWYNLAFLLLLVPFLFGRVRETLADWNWVLQQKDERKQAKHEHAKAPVEDTPKPKATTTNHSPSFELFVKQMGSSAVQQRTSVKYQQFERKHGKIGFGESGVNEFVGAVMLAAYRPTLEKDIDHGIEQVFTKKFSPLQFSEYMDGIVNRSDVPYTSWSAVYNYVKNNMPWIQTHDAASEQATISPVVAEALKGNQS